MATNNKQEVKKEYAKELFSLWEKTSKKGEKYLENKLLKGFYNTNKKNPKEPDLRIHKVEVNGDLGGEYASIWCNVSKAGNKYLAGHINDEKKTKLIGFINKETKDGKLPKVRIYTQEEYDKFNKKSNVKDTKDEVINSDDLPF